MSAPDSVPVWLRLHVDRSVRETRQALHDEIEELRGQLIPQMQDIRAALDKVAAVGAEKPKVIFWPDLSPEEYERLWPQLCHWIGTVLCARYPAQADALRTCWQEHPAAVDAVTAAWLAWWHCHRSPDAKPTSPAEWQAKHLPDMATQLETAFEKPCGHGS